jgi:glycosyltransferase involved in cell wall biosynthesis
VCDLVRQQEAAGHTVGIVCDAGQGTAEAESRLESLSKSCSLGIHRIAMSRLPSPSDLRNTVRIAKITKSAAAEIIHGHGAKGGLYARLVALSTKARSVYTPHGGSLHYTWTRPVGFLSLLTEKILVKLGNGYVFVCEFERQEFEKKIGLAGSHSIVVQNGLNLEDFADADPSPVATDLLFVGEMRGLKGVDLLIVALAKIPEVTLTLVGDGPDLQQFQQLTNALGLSSRATFVGRLPMRDALKLGRMLIVPSRNESFPYVVLEAMAAGVPTLASRVGGIAEILPPEFLFEAVEPKSIASLIRLRLENFAGCTALTEDVRSKLRDNNSVSQMTAKINQFYDSLQTLSNF